MKKNFLRVCALLACSLALSSCDTSGSAPVSPVQPTTPAPTPEDEGKRGTIPATGGELKHQNVTVAAGEVSFIFQEVDLSTHRQGVFMKSCP